MNTQAIAYQENILMMERVVLSDIAASYGTPCYVYSKAIISARYQEYVQGFGDTPHQICYSVKANSNLSVLKVLADLGSGFDIVSGGELARVLAVGADPEKIVFSGVGKREDEIRTALEVKIACFNVESVAELERIESIAVKLGVVAPVSLRVNPNVDAKTHPYISTGLKENKFGIPIENALRVYQTIAASTHLNAVGIDCHIGSQLVDVSPFSDVAEKVLALVDALQAEGITLEHIDLGGGLGIDYQGETPPGPEAFAKMLCGLLEGRKEAIVVEPGRSIVGNAGVFLTGVEYVKPGDNPDDKHFCIVDGAMNDLIRPALYGAWQNILPLQEKSDAPTYQYDVVGPVCETADFLGKDRALSVEAGDVLAVLGSGAYGFVMASNYNSRPKPTEVLVDGESYRVIRARETVAKLLENEQSFL